MAETPEQRMRRIRAQKEAKLGGQTLGQVASEAATQAKGALPGALHGLELTGKKFANLVLPKAAQPQAITDEAIAAREKELKPKSYDSSYAMGRFGGEMAPSVVPGIAAERAAVAGLSKIPKAVELGKTAWGSLGRLARSTGIGAGEGAIVAPIEKRGEGAGVGAGLSAVLHAAMGGGKRVLGLAATDRMTPAAKQALEEMKKVDPKAFIPNSAALKDGWLKKLYENVIENLPGIGGITRQQFADAVETANRRMVDEITPVGTALEHVYPKGGKMHQVFEELDPTGGSGGKWDQALGTFKDDVFDARYLHLPDDVTKKLAEMKLPGIPESGEMTGKQLTKLRTDIQSARDELVQQKAGGNKDYARGLTESLDKAREDILELIKDQVTPGGSRAGVPPPHLEEWLDNLDQYKNYEDYVAAAKRQSTADPSFGAVAQATAQRNAEAGLRGKAGPLQTLGENFEEVFPMSKARPSLFKQEAAKQAAGSMVPMPSTGITLFDLAAATGAPSAALWPMTSKWAQRGLAQGFKTPRKTLKIFEKYPEIGRALRGAAVTKASEGEY